MRKSLLMVVLAAGVAFAQKTDSKPLDAQKQVREETTPQKDVVCGMTIDPKTAEAKMAYKGKMYYFCSKEDKQEFEKNPDKFAAKK